MKRIISCLVGILIMNGLAWAGPIRVITTTEDLAAIVREVGGQIVAVESLTRGSQDPHFLEARPSLILKTSKAGLFVQVGLDLEVGWAPALLVGSRNPNIQPGVSGYLDASRDIKVLEIPSVPLDRTRGDVHPFGNPHYWLDPENGKIIARSIAQGLSALLPDKTQEIEQNLKGFTGRLDEAVIRWKARMKPYEGTKVITYHRSWTYFAERFGLVVVSYVEPKPGIPPSSAHIAQLVPLMKHEGVKLIIKEPYFSRSIPDLLSRETGAKVLALPQSVGGAEGIRTYFDLFDHLIGQVIATLTRG